MQKRAYDFILWAVFVSMAGAAFMAVVGIATVAPFLMRPARLAVFSQNPLAAVTPTPSPFDTAGLPSDLSSKALASEEALAKEGWQTYRNEEYGFTLKFPADWISASPAYGSGYLGGAERTGKAYHVLGLAAQPPQGDWSILVTVIPQSVDELLGDPEYYWRNSWEVRQRETVTFSGVHAEAVMWSNGAVIYYVPKSNQPLTVQFDGSNNDTGHAIISSLKFLP